MEALVGTCGFAEAQERVFRTLDMVEVQRTFYQPPRRDTVKRWRTRAGPDFVFAVKAWQLITHRPSSPTYRKLREPLTEEQLKECGDFQWNATTHLAWQTTLDRAEALGAEAIVLQTPRTFRPSLTNLDRLRGFVERADRQGQILIFEPRGEQWGPGLVRELAEELGLIHGVDPFLDQTATPSWIYYRLHGRPAYHYRYRYSDRELDWLAERIREGGTVRVLFNNDAMASDARRLKERLDRR